MSKLEAGDRVYIAMVNDKTGEEKRRYGNVEKFVDVIGMVDIRFDDSELITPVDFMLVFKEGEESKPKVTDYTVMEINPSMLLAECPRCKRVGKYDPDYERFDHVVEGIIFQRSVQYCERCIVCHGQAFTESDYEDEHGIVQRVQETCQACEGIGWV